MAQMRLAVRALVEFLLRSGDIDSRFTGFDRALEGARIHRRLQKAAGEGYAAEVFLSAERMVEGMTFTIEGRADGIFTGEDGLAVIDEIKTTAVPLEEITEELDFCHWAQGMVYGAIYAQQQGLAALRVRLTYYQIDENKIVRFTRQFTRAELEEFLLGLLRRYAPWARRQLSWGEKRAASLEALNFPFERYREGQRALAGEVYRACRTGKDEAHKGGARLFCQAPTGIGKTMSALFPALKAMGGGCGDKIFYLTARGTTQAAAEEAIARLRASQPEMSLRSITLTAKEKACLCKGEDGRPACLPEKCPYAKGYYDRVKDALAALLDGGGCCSRAALEEAAKKYSVCPFELGLDLSEWCDVIIGDFNYLFDPVVRLRRFFDSAGEYIFLIDEAHNLPDRARGMYSASFCKSSLTEAKRALGKGRSALKTALAKADSAFLTARREVEALAPRSTAGESSAPDAPQQTALFEDGGAEAAPERALPEPLFAKDGTAFFKDLPTFLLQPLQALLAPLQKWLEDNPDSEAHAQLLELYFAVQDILRAAARFDEHFAAEIAARGSELHLELLCLDPAPFVDESLACGRAAVMFSATLTPPGYYRSVLGCADARAVALASPFPRQNLGLYCLPYISTLYRDREKSVQPIAEALAVMAGGKVGNYLAFFPSYAYLKQVYDAFTARYPDIAVMAQRSGAGEAERAEFLAHFEPEPEHTLLGFGVLGGVFGEGIDLAGSQLIGCAVVGVGLPQVNPRQEILRRYYDEACGKGFDYAYRCPGMNKVLQAAGRVIRTSEDKGVVLLLDSRFANDEYRRLFPAHWDNVRYLRDGEELKERLEEFWRE